MRRKEEEESLPVSYYIPSSPFFHLLMLDILYRREGRGGDEGTGGRRTMATVLNWGRRRRRDTEGPKTKKNLRMMMESRRTTNDGRGKKKRIRWRGGNFVPAGNHLLFRRDSPIHKKLSNPAVLGEVFVLCLIWTLDGGEERRRRAWMKKRPYLA